MMHSFFDVDRPVVIGHRGAAGDRPENTLASFDTALSMGAQILESDIHISSDGVPILLHDPALDRTSNGRGSAAESDWAQIRALDAGGQFRDESGETPFLGQGIAIPSLEETFERFPNARFNLEIKCRGLEGIRATLDLVEKFDRADRTLLAAGEDDIMQDLRSVLTKHSLQPALGASLGEIIKSVASAVEDKPMPEGVMALQVPPTFAERPLVTRELVDHAHAHGVQIHVWTVNDLDEMKTLLDLGVDGIITDYPGRMHDWLVRDGRR
ncbi:MAG: glycerophosphodiester phosphodiesterase [Myxococcales bacterium]|nr:glycerophosphodiester phosphodiesterase [Myxococcales bacterium]HIK86188.1 glycerophosphodiester phosphodiesterase [Myxococcales bacterium]